MKNIYIALVAFILILGLVVSSSRADIQIPALTELYANNVQIPEYDPSQSTPTHNPTLLNIPWQGADLDENGIWNPSVNTTYITVESSGYYTIAFSGCVISSNPNPVLTRFHVGVAAQTQRFQYSTVVVNLSASASQWLYISWTYHITNPSAQFIYAQLESSQPNTYICQARLQILRIG